VYRDIADIIGSAFSHVQACNDCTLFVYSSITCIYKTNTYTKV